MASWLKKGDIFAQPLKLRINGEHTHQTYLGVIFTLIWLGSIVAIAVYQLMNMLSYKDPTITLETVNQNSYIKADVGGLGFLPVMIPYKSNLFPIDKADASRYFTAYIQQRTWTSKFIDGQLKVEMSAKHFPLGSCSVFNQTKSPPAYSFINNDSTLIKALPQYGLCPPFDIGNLTIIGNPADQLYQTVGLIIKPCTMSSGCASAAELAQLSFQFLLPASTVEMQDYEHPHRYFLDADNIVYLNPAINQIYTAKIGSTDIQDYSGWLPNWKTIREFFEIKGVAINAGFRHDGNTQCTVDQSKSINLQDCPSYFEYNLQSSGVRVTHKRKYSTVLDVLAAIGGIQSTVALVIVLIYKPINEYFLKKHLVNMVYPLIAGKKNVDAVFEERRTNLAQERKLEKEKQQKEVEAKKLEKDKAKAEQVEELKRRLGKRGEYKPATHKGNNLAFDSFQLLDDDQPVEAVDKIIEDDVQVMLESEEISNNRDDAKPPVNEQIRNLIDFVAGVNPYGDRPAGQGMKIEDVDEQEHFVQGSDRGRIVSSPMMELPKQRDEEKGTHFGYDGIPGTPDMAWQRLDYEDRLLNSQRDNHATENRDSSGISRYKTLANDVETEKIEDDENTCLNKVFFCTKKKYKSNIELSWAGLWCCCKRNKKYVTWFQRLFCCKKSEKQISWFERLFCCKKNFSQITWFESKICCKKSKGDLTWFDRSFLCLKTIEEHKEAKMNSQLMKRIDESIDVINMVRDFNYTKIMVHYLFEERHFSTAQHAGFELWRNEEITRETQIEEFKKKLREKNALKWYNEETRVHEEVMSRSLHSFIDSMVEISKKLKSKEDPLNVYDSRTLDTFFNKSIAGKKDQFSELHGDGNTTLGKNAIQNVETAPIELEHGSDDIWDMLFKLKKSKELIQVQVKDALNLQEEFVNLEGQRKNLDETYRKHLKTYREIQVKIASISSFRITHAEMSKLESAFMASAEQLSVCIDGMIAVHRRLTDAVGQRDDSIADALALNYRLCRTADIEFNDDEKELIGVEMYMECIEKSRLNLIKFEDIMEKLKLAKKGLNEDELAQKAKAVDAALVNVDLELEKFGVGLGFTDAGAKTNLLLKRDNLLIDKDELDAELKTIKDSAAILNKKITACSEKIKNAEMYQKLDKQISLRQSNDQYNKLWNEYCAVLHAMKNNEDLSKVQILPDISTNEKIYEKPKIGSDRKIGSNRFVDRKKAYGKPGKNRKNSFDMKEPITEKKDDGVKIEFKKGNYFKKKFSALVRKRSYDK